MLENTPDDAGFMIMKDDGRGHNVHIPSMIVEDEAAKPLIDYMKSHKDSLEAGIGPFPQLKISFEMKKPEGGEKVHYDFWLEGGERRSVDFISKWRPYHEKLADYVEFRPHYVNYKCAGKCSEETLKKNCYS